MSRFKATGLICKVFDERGIRYHVEDHDGMEAVCAGFGIDCGPSIMLHYISTDDGNDVVVAVP